MHLSAGIIRIINLQLLSAEATSVKCHSSRNLQLQPMNQGYFQLPRYSFDQAWQSSSIP